MKTTFYYGLIMAIINMVLTYGMYFAGFHDSVEKLHTGQMIAGITGTLAGIVCLVLSVRARRAETPASEPFGYGRSFFAAFLTAFWSTLLGTISWVTYIALVNPNIRELMVQGEIAKASAKGMSSAQLEQAEGVIRMMMGPLPQALFAFFFGLIAWTLISLIVAAFIRRPAAAEPPLA